MADRGGSPSSVIGGPTSVCLTLTPIPFMVEHMMHLAAIRYVDRVDSTQSEAKRLASAGAIPALGVVATEQTSGRGRLGREWNSPPGNLYVTLWLRPPLALSEWPQ